NRIVGFLRAPHLSISSRPSPVALPSVSVQCRLQSVAVLTPAPRLGSTSTVLSVSGDRRLDSVDRRRRLRHTFVPASPPTTAPPPPWAVSTKLLEFATVASNPSMASSSSSGPLKPVADLPSSCSPASHHPLQFITDVGLAASHAESKVSPCRQADGSPSAEVMGPEVSLPEDIIWKIHALMAIQDAARAACLSHDFLHSWRCYPKLIFDMRALGKQTRDFTK
uniref:Uncharacterized protein n=3 Tax=Aegilops tauschii subsp. strangulata TaxID=200361 RepID=A0A453AUB8_AEGTS